MKTEVQELPENRVRLRVEVPAGDVDHAFDRALSDLSRQVRVPGFRKGKAPKRLLMQRLGRETVVEEALRDHLGGWYSRAVAVAGIDPIDRPTIDWDAEPEQGSPFSFSAEVEVKPAPEVGDYRGIEAVRYPDEVPEEAIAAELERLQLSVAELRPAERPARQGDFVVVDFEGTADGKPIANGRMTDYAIDELGAGPLDELEAGIVGMRAGEEREIDVDLEEPDSGRARKARFKVRLKDVKERALPELDDELATTASEFDTLAQLRDDITRRLAEVIGREVELQFRRAVLDELATRLVSPLPDALVKDRMSAMTRNLMDTLASRGLNLDDYLARTGQSAEQVVQAIRPQAEDAVRKDLVLEAVAEAEGIDVSDELLEEFVREEAVTAGEEAEGAAARLLGDPATKTALRTDLRLQKALDVVVAAAKPISPETAAARAKLWTPEQESAGSGANTPGIWTPGSGEPANR